MPTVEETMAAARQHLLEGRVQEAHDLLDAKLKEPAVAAPPVAPAAPPIVARPIPEWVTDAKFAAGLLGELLQLFEPLVMHLGSTPAHVAALARLKSLHAGLSK